MFKRLFDWLWPASKEEPDRAPTRFAKYEDKPAWKPARSVQVEGHLVYLPSERTYEIPMGDALLLMLDLERKAKTDHWAKRDLEELVAALNRGAHVRFTRPY